MFRAVSADTRTHFLTWKYLFPFVIILSRSTVFIRDVFSSTWWLLGVCVAFGRSVPLSTSGPRVFRNNLQLALTSAVRHTFDLWGSALVAAQNVRNQLLLIGWGLDGNIHHSLSERFGWTFIDGGAELFEGLFKQVMFSLLIFSEILQLSA